MKVVFAASECVPFVKTGGLADVIGELPESIARETSSFSLKTLSLSKGDDQRSSEKSQNSAGLQKIETVTILPLYQSIDRKKYGLKRFPGRLVIPVGDQLEYGYVYAQTRQKRSQDGTPIYFVENERYFDRPGLYGDEKGDYPDNDERFIFFSRAVLELCKFIDFQPDIIHCHDWQTGLIPAYLKTVYARDAFFYRTATVFTIHNIVYQGVFPKQTIFLAGFGWHNFTPEKLEYYGNVSFLKAGLVFADKISTVSPTYALEIQNDPSLGRGMEGILKARSDDFVGILNGINHKEWDPARDAKISVKYTPRDVLKKKIACKKDLQKTAQLPEENFPLVGMVTRDAPQKGIRRLKDVVPALSGKNLPFQWVSLVAGDRSHQPELIELSENNPTKFRFESGFRNDLAHKIYAGSDIFFMPSEFEPCGISQMIAMRYGAIPVVTPVGGFRDTVVHFDPQTGTGNGFVSKDLSNEALTAVLEESITVYQNPGLWNKCVANAMSTDFSWPNSALKYIGLYENALSLAFQKLYNEL